MSIEPLVAMIYLRDEAARNHFGEWFKRLNGVKDLSLVCEDSSHPMGDGAVVDLKLRDCLEELRRMMKS